MVKAQLQSLELADAYKKRFMPQNGQVAVLKCSPTWKKMRKSFKTLSELKLELIPKACKREAMAHIIRPPPPPPPPVLEGCSFKMGFQLDFYSFSFKPEKFRLVA